MPDNNMPAERFPPGTFIKREIEARGWTQGDLAEITAIDRAALNLILNGRRQLTPETAASIGEAFGTGAEVWLNLESSYQLWRQQPNVKNVARRASLWEMAPMKELLRRGWIERSENIDVLEGRVCRFFEIKSISEAPSFYAVARKPNQEPLTPTQTAWLFRAKHLARAVSVSAFDPGLSRVLKNLKELLVSPEEIHTAPKVLAQGGVRLVALEAIPGTKIDGATFWLSDKEPVIALSFRYDRIDWFWHTLLHEIKHVLSKDGLRQNAAVDIRLVGKDAKLPSEKPDFELAADGFACGYLIDQDELNDFIGRAGPNYSKLKILQFAASMGVHPGLVVGQLQHRKEILYSHSREMLVPAKEHLGDSVLMEGWGHQIEGVA
jgi:HTH-type transcriptional regulator/antitoxin HigA